MRRFLAGLVLMLGLAIAPTVTFADTWDADADDTVVGFQSAQALGTVAPGAVINVNVHFELRCAGSNHVNNGQSVIISFDLADSTVPAGSLTATNSSIGPIPSSWPDDATGAPNCGSPLPAPIADNGDSEVTITAPLIPGDYTYIAHYTRALSPAESPASTVTPNVQNVTFTLTVADTDADDDGIEDDDDNCPNNANPLQENFDNDTLGDACDPDDDNDGVLDGPDNCDNSPPLSTVGPDGCPVVPADTTPPEINYDYTCSDPAGSNPPTWCRGTITVDWTVSDPDSDVTIDSGCDDITITTDTASIGTTLSCQAASDGGTAGPISVTVFRDGTNPVPSLNAVADSCSVPGNNDWCRGQQTAGFSATDAASGMDDPCDAAAGASCNFTKSTTTNGTAVNIPSGQVCDVAGNCHAGISAGPYKIDSVAPTVTCRTPAPVFVLNKAGALVYADVTDAVSLPLNLEVSSAADTSSVGSKTVSVTGFDNAGNSYSETCSYSVVFGVCALYDQNRSHKAGSTVPIKIQLCDANGVNVSDADVVVQAFTLKRVDTSASGALEDTGNANQPEYNFRYDSSLLGYIFNLSTKNPSPALGQKNSLGIGTWQLCFKVDGVESTGYCVRFDVK